MLATKLVFFSAAVAMFARCAVMRAAQACEGVCVDMRTRSGGVNQGHGSSGLSIDEEGVAPDPLLEG